jgi:hypothetical protein
LRSNKSSEFRKIGTVVMLWYKQHKAIVMGIIAAI